MTAECRPVAECSLAESRRRICRLLLICCLAAMPPAVGCGPPQAAPSDVAAATRLMREAMDQWQQGRSPAELRDLQPPVYVADDWWHSGYRLDSYDVHGEGELVGTNVRVVVHLQADDPSGKQRRRTQAYLVTTTPALTIAREDR